MTHRVTIMRAVFNSRCGARCRIVWRASFAAAAHNVSAYLPLLSVHATTRRITNRWTRAAGACFVTNLVRRCLIEFAPPRQLNRWAAQIQGVENGNKNCEEPLGPSRDYSTDPDLRGCRSGDRVALPGVRFHRAPPCRTRRCD